MLKESLKKYIIQDIKSSANLKPLKYWQPMREREIHECNNHYYLLDNIQIFFDRSDNFKKSTPTTSPSSYSYNLH